MPDFSHLKALEQRGDKERPYKFEQIAGEPTIWFLPATDANPTFLNETLRRANARAGRNRRGQALTAGVLHESRQEDKEVFARCCARRWNVKDADSNDVEFSEANCLEFFEALPDWLFDDVRTWLTNASNFVEALSGDTMGED